MTDAADFLAAIVDRPDDDLPRLVFADFLEEQGDADRAEFIRVQCRLAGLPAGHPDRPALQAREAALHTAHRRRWELPGLVGYQKFRRGFVEFVHTTADSLVAAAGRLFAAAPVRALRVQSADPLVQAVARLPGLARVEALDLSNNYLGAGGRLEQFLAEADLPRLRRLTVRNNGLWPEGLAAVGRAPAAGRLDALNLSGNPLGDRGAEVLAGEPGFARLRELTARNDMVDYSDSVHAAGAAALAGSRTLTGLRALDLGGHFIGDAGLIDLVTSPNAARLTDLDLADNAVGALGEAAVEAVVGSPHLGNLRRLSLAGSRSRDRNRNRVTRLAAEALAGWPRLGAGVRVDLRGCDLDPAGRAALVGSPFAGQFLLDP